MRCWWSFILTRVNKQSSNHTWKKLKKEDGFNLVDASFYISLIGFVLYLSASKHDIMNATKVLLRFVNATIEIYLKRAKEILWYVQSTMDYGVLSKRSSNMNLTRFPNNNEVGTQDEMTNTSIYYFRIRCHFLMHKD